MSMLHSLWQSGILLLVYIIAEKTLQQKFTPLQKKNLLFFALILQVVLFAITFCSYYFTTGSTGTFSFFNTGAADLLAAEKLQAIAPWVFRAYLLIGSYKLCKAFYCWYGFKKQFGSGLQKPPVSLKLFTTAKQFQFGIKRKVQLWLSSTIDTPITFGFLRPVIVLPAALVNHLSLQQAETLILHELAHIKANDYLFNWLLIGMETVFFFNPFVLYCCRKIKLEREKYCDITVTAFEYPVLVYAEALLQVQKVKQLQPQYQLAAAGNPPQLFKRIQFFTNPKNQLQGNNRRFLFPLLLSFFIMLTGAALFFQMSMGTAAQKQIIPSVTASVNDETALPKFVNNIINSLTDENLKKMSAAVEKQKPLIEKKLKEMEPALKAFSTKAEALAKEFDGNFVTPVAIQENDATRQIVIKEEQSGSKNATVKVYTLMFTDGKWILQPQWKLAAKEVADTLNRLTDTSFPQNNSQEN